MQGVNFLNTILVYHLDKEDHPNGSDGRLPEGLGDKFFAGGWYASDTDEVVKVEEKIVNGKTVFDVNTEFFLR